MSQDLPIVKEGEEEEKISKKEKVDKFHSVKGTRDLLEGEYFRYLGFFEKASEIALYYGFTPVETPILEQAELFTVGIGNTTEVVQKEMYTLRTKGGDHLAMRPEGTAAVLRSYLEHGMQSLPQPVMLYYYGPFFRHENPQRGRFRELRQFGLEIIGAEKSVADALIIKVILTILEEAGYGKLSVDMNSLGDKECRVAYRKELVGYFRKHLNKLTPHQKDLLRENPFRLLDSKDENLEEIKVGVPESVHHLTGPAKQHFKEVLKYLESMDVDYRINSSLVRGLDYYSRTVFEIFEPQKDPALSPLALAAGGRYDGLGKLLGAKKPTPGIGGAIGVDRVVTSGMGETLAPRLLKKPKVFFIQFGFDAKLKSLPIIEALRKARVPIRQSLSKDSLSAQLSIAERMGIPWVIILGQREVIENTIIVRNMENRSQDVVPVADLAEYIKKRMAAKA